MNENEQWVACGATQGFEDICTHWEGQRAESWDTLPESEIEVLHTLLDTEQTSSYPFGAYFCHYYAFRFAPWLEPLAKKHGIVLENGWENDFAQLLFQAACNKDKNFIKEAAAIPGMRRDILCDGLNTRESMIKAMIHLASYGTKENKDRSGAAILRLLGFAAAVQMFHKDVDLFLKKAFKIPEYNLWDRRQFLYFLTFRFARARFDTFFSQLSELYDNTPALDRTQLYQLKYSQSMNTELLEYIVLEKTSGILNHTLEKPDLLKDAVARHKCLMMDWEEQQHIPVRAAVAQEMLQNIQTSYLDLMDALKKEQASVAVHYRTNDGLSIPAGTVLTAVVRELPCKDAYLEHTEETFKISALVQTPVQIAPCADSAREETVEIVVSIDSKYFKGYCLLDWQWEGLPGVRKIGNEEKSFRVTKYPKLSEYLYNSTFPDRQFPGKLPQAIVELLKGTDFSETQFSNLRNPKTYAGNIKIDRTRILTLAAIETMMELRATGRPTESTDVDFMTRYVPAELQYMNAKQEYAKTHDAARFRQETERFQTVCNAYKQDNRLETYVEDENIDPAERILENHRMFWQNVNDRLFACHYFGLYLVNPYERLLASIMACNSPIDFYRFLWSWQKDTVR